MCEDRLDVHPECARHRPPRALSISMAVVAVASGLACSLGIWFIYLEFSDPDATDWRGVCLAIGLMLLMISVPALVASYFVWRGSEWARAAMVGLMGVALIIGVATLIGLPVIIIAVPVIWVLLRSDVRDYCSQ